MTDDWVEMRFFADAKKIWDFFGFAPMLKLVVLPRVAYHLGYKGDLYIPALLKWQRAAIAPVIERYQNKALYDTDNRNGDTIWTCWWQGEKQMPDVIKICYKSLLRNASGRKVVLITADNFREYTDIPSWITEKAGQGKISLSHLSDIIRLNLLVNHGGVWVDSAVAVTSPIDIRGFYMPRMERYDKSLNQGRWGFGVIGAPARHKLMRFMQEALTEYWSRYDTAVDYLMFDGFMRIAYEEFEDVRREIDSLAVSSPDLHWARYNFMKESDRKKMDALLERNQFLSLTWRIDYPMSTADGALTYYGDLIGRYSL